MRAAGITCSQRLGDKPGTKPRSGTAAQTSPDSLTRAQTSNSPGPWGLSRLLNDEFALYLRVITDPRGRVQSGAVSFIEELLRRDGEDNSPGQS
jgi:hypothetical protein